MLPTSARRSPVRSASRRTTSGRRFRRAHPRVARGRPDLQRRRAHRRSPPRGRACGAGRHGIPRSSWPRAAGSASMFLATCRWATAAAAGRVELRELEGQVHEADGGELRAALGPGGRSAPGDGRRDTPSRTRRARARGRPWGTPPRPRAAPEADAGTAGMEHSHALTHAAAKQPASHARSPAPPISQSTSQDEPARRRRDEYVLPAQVPVYERRRTLAARGRRGVPAAARRAGASSAARSRRRSAGGGLRRGPDDADPVPQPVGAGPSGRRTGALGVELADAPSQRGGHGGVEDAASPRRGPEGHARHRVHLQLIRLPAFQRTPPGTRAAVAGHRSRSTS